MRAISRNNDHKASPKAQAALLIQWLAERSTHQGPFFAYGSSETVHVLVGRRDSFRLPCLPSADEFWLALRHFLSSHRGDYIGGFIGFDPGSLLYQPGSYARHQEFRADLFVAECVIACTRQGMRVVRGCCDLPTFSPGLIDLNLNQRNPVNAVDIDDASEHEKYIRSAGCILDEIRSGLLTRVTLARKVLSPKRLNIFGTFLSERNSHPLARSFYCKNDAVEFGGQCPELLAEGSPSLFVSHKLSGTYRIGPGQDIDALISRFQQDARICREHLSGTATIARELHSIARVRSDSFKVMRLPTLLHGWSEYRCALRVGCGVHHVLRSVFPYGVSPVDKGLGLLGIHEDFERGPYYGIAGLIGPDQEFSFVQILRSAFDDQGGSYLLTGAAITADSTPEIELEETISKLDSISIFLKEQ